MASHIENAIEGLFNNHSYIDGTVEYCHQVYGIDKQDGFKQSTVRTNEALESVATHINIVSMNIDHYVHLQTKQLGHLVGDLHTIQQRMAIAHSTTGARAPCLRRGARDPDPPLKRVQQLEGDAIPVKSRKLPPFHHEFNYALLSSQRYTVQPVKPPPQPEAVHANAQEEERPADASAAETPGLQPPTTTLQPPPPREPASKAPPALPSHRSYRKSFVKESNP